MALKQVLEVIELIDAPEIEADAVAGMFASRGLEEARLQPLETDRGSTTFVEVRIPGRRGKAAGGDAPTLGIVGMLGGVSARPEVIGMVSDADGAAAALAAALKLADMRRAGDLLEGDVIVTTHLCPAAPVTPHDPVPYMASPVSNEVRCRRLVSADMDALLSIDATKGNRVVNHRGIAISPTVKAGYVLRVSEPLLSLLEYATGRPPVVFPVTTQDITPYGNGLFHLNSILQPATVTEAPVVGVAVTAETAVPGCASGASHDVDIELAARFSVEVAKGFTAGRAPFFDAGEFAPLVELYGPMTRLQTVGKG